MPSFVGCGVLMLRLANQLPKILSTRMVEIAVHVSHDAVAKRLKRAHGHLQNVITMLSEDRACLDVAQQLHAVEQAIAAADPRVHATRFDWCVWC